MRDTFLSSVFLVTVSLLSYIVEKYQKNLYICFINYKKAFNCVDRVKLWNVLEPCDQVGAVTEHKPGAPYGEVVVSR